MIQWRFNPKSPGDMDIDPVQGEFFTTRDIDNISTAVVREGIQNALDERNKEGQLKTVKVRIFLSGDKYAVGSEKYDQWFETLLPHLKSKGSGLKKMPDFTRPMKFLVFEDFNTRGLEGSTLESFVEDLNDGIQHNFYYFWRNVGRSGKTNDQLGRWGLGKTVFPASSEINTFFGVTIRASDRRKLLMGQSILRTHKREDTRAEVTAYKPYGMFGNYKDKDFFAEPIESDNDIRNFSEQFCVSRKDEPGFSIIVPFVTQEITIDHLTYAVIEQYFYPILEGKLEVELTFEDNAVILTKDTLQLCVENINFFTLTQAEDKKVRSKENFIRLFDFAKWTLGIGAEDFYHLNPLELSKVPRWNKSLFSDEEKLAQLREKFEQGDRVAFKVPLKYQPENGETKICWFDAFLEKDSTLNKPENLFVRDGITISGISSMDKGLARGIVVIHDSDLARMVGDSENPAHTEWQADSRNFKDKYVHGKEALVFVKATLKKLYENLQRPLEGLQKDLIIDFFSIPLEIKEPENKKQKETSKSSEKGENDSEEEVLPVINGRKPPILIEKIPTGLKLIKNREAIEMPETVRLKLGYDVARGNPVFSYQELDFDVAKAPVDVQSTGVYFTKREKNEIEFIVENQEHFEISMTGFDENRDLFIKIQ